jgi:hypothetical protein
VGVKRGNGTDTESVIHQHLSTCEQFQHIKAFSKLLYSQQRGWASTDYATKMLKLCSKNTQKLLEN